MQRRMAMQWLVTRLRWRRERRCARAGQRQTKTISCLTIRWR